MNRKAFLIVCMIVMSVADVFAQGGAITELKPVFEKLKSLKSYSYESQTTALFPNGQKDQQHAKVYMDRLNKKLSYKTEQQLVVLNASWLFQADHEHHTASVFNVSKYDNKHKDVLPQIESIFQYDMASMFMDSVLTKYGKLLSTTQSNNLVTYKVGFRDPGAALKEMNIVYNTVTQLPEQISFKMESPMQGGKKVKMEIVCKNYNTQVPASVFDEKQYFNLVKGKPVLVQFKNYKLYSEL